MKQVEDKFGKFYDFVDHDYFYSYLSDNANDSDEYEEDVSVEGGDDKEYVEGV